MDIQTDDRGVEYVEHGNVETLPKGWALCGHCGRGWNDEKSTSVTPTPSGRCPFEYEHEQDEQTTEKDVTLDLIAALEMYAGTMGSDETVIDEVAEGERNTVRVTLSNGEVYELRVRNVPA
jgi:hypothetical protein